MDSNIIFCIFGNLRMLTKGWTADPLVTAEILQRIQGKIQNHICNLLCLESCECTHQHFKNVVSKVRNFYFWNMATLKLWTMQVELLYYWDSLKFLFWKLWNFESSSMCNIESSKFSKVWKLKHFETSNLWNINIRTLRNFKNILKHI